MAHADDVPEGQVTSPRGSLAAMGTVQCHNPIAGDVPGAAGPQVRICPELTSAVMLRKAVPGT